MLAIGTAALVGACDEKPTPSTTPSATPATSTPLAPDPIVQRVRVPSGPRFAIVPGQGVGPIRPGATVATVERHMQAKCERVTPESCRYVDRGIEFHLDEKGVVKRLHLHRVGRAADGDATWGPFNGAIPPDLAFGMLPSAIQEHLGKPKRIETGAAGAHPATAEQHHYDGVVLEFDRMPSDQLVLGGIRIPS